MNSIRIKSFDFYLFFHEYFILFFKFVSIVTEYENHVLQNWDPRTFDKYNIKYNIDSILVPF